MAPFQEQEEFVSRSEVETAAWAGGFAQRLKPGDSVALSGELGAGKTLICKAVARSLGYAGDVHSPTYALVHEYLGGSVPVFHMDLYRLAPGAAREDLEEIGLEHYFRQPGICLVEWPERLSPDAVFTYRVEIESLDAESRRIRARRE